MIRSAIAVILILSTPAAVHAEEAPQTRTWTLKDAFATALERNETIAISDHAVRQAESSVRQTFGENLPELSYGRSVTMEEYSKTGHNGYFEVSKTGLTVFGEFASLRAAGATAEQRRFERRRTEQLLLLDVAAAFYDLLLAEANVKATRRVVDLASERLEELNDRVRLGKTRRADRLGQEVLSSNFHSQLEENLRLSGERRDLLAFLIGMPRLEGDISDAQAAIQPLSVDAYLATVDERPDVRAARLNVDALKGSLEVTRAEFFPSLGVSAAAYTDRALSNEDVDWDVLFSLNVPVWDWFARGAAMDAAGSELSQGEKEWSLARRLADLEIRNAYRDLMSARKQLEIRQKAVEWARQDYELQVKDDEQGLITNLELLESLDRLNTAELAYNSALLREKRSAIALKVAAGSDPSEILQ